MGLQTTGNGKQLTTDKKNPKSKKVMALLSKKTMNFAYGMGAAVIVGALFKIIHFELGPLTGTRMLAVGL
jgi:hypothetical protein